MPIFVMPDIDLPEDVKSGPSTRYPFETMKVGETFFLEGRKASKFAPYAGKFARRIKRKFQVRDITMAPVKTNGVQTGWKLAQPGETDAVTGCAIKRLTDPTPEELKKAEEDAAKRGEKKAGEAGDPPPPADPAPADPAPAAKAPAPAAAPAKAPAPAAKR